MSVFTTKEIGKSRTLISSINSITNMNQLNLLKANYFFVIRLKYSNSFSGITKYCSRKLHNILHIVAVKPRHSLQPLAKSRIHDFSDRSPFYHQNVYKLHQILLLFKESLNSFPDNNVNFCLSDPCLREKQYIIKLLFIW